MKPFQIEDDVAGPKGKTFELRTNNRQDPVTPKGPKFKFTIGKGKSQVSLQLKRLKFMMKSKEKKNKMRMNNSKGKMKQRMNRNKKKENLMRREHLKYKVLPILKKCIKVFLLHHVISQ